MSTKTDLPTIPDALVDVALVDSKISAATGGVSLSQWHELVRLDEAPQPVIRAPRYTRWRLIDVKSYWAARAARGVDAQVADMLTARAMKASSMARKPEAVAKSIATRARNKAEREAAVKSTAAVG